jgi:hypothetical protein
MRILKIIEIFKMDENDCMADIGLSFFKDNYINRVPHKETQEFFKKIGWEAKKPGRTLTFTVWLYLGRKSYCLTLDLSYNYGYDWTPEQLANAGSVHDSKYKALEEMKRRRDVYNLR